MPDKNYDKKPLYKDKQIEINYFQKSPEYAPSFEDHALIIKGKDSQTQYILQRGVLAELARTPMGWLEQKLDTINHMLLHQVKEEKISVDRLRTALIYAFKEEEKRYSEAEKK